MQIKKISVVASIGVVILMLSLLKPTESRILYRNENIYAVGIDQNIIYHDIKKEYDITIDSFNIKQNIIRRNYNLARLLSEAGLGNKKVNQATYRSAEVFDIRKIKAGNQYRLYYTKDSSNTLKYFVYKHSPTEYLKITLGDNPNAVKGEKEITNVRKTCSGKVSSSLWETMIENDIDPMMAIKLSEIYAWKAERGWFGSWFGGSLERSFGSRFDGGRTPSSTRRGEVSEKGVS